MKPTQRFIAGATCPNCNQIDCLLVDIESQAIECVDCHFTQTAEQRDKNQQQKTTTAQKKVPKKVNVSDIIRINHLKN